MSLAISMVILGFVLISIAFFAGVIELALVGVGTLASAVALYEGLQLSIALGIGAAVSALSLAGFVLLVRPRLSKRSSSQSPSAPDDFYLQGQPAVIHTVHASNKFYVSAGGSTWEAEWDDPACQVIPQPGETVRIVRQDTHRPLVVRVDSIVVATIEKNDTVKIEQ